MVNSESLQLPTTSFAYSKVFLGVFVVFLWFMIVNIIIFNVQKSDSTLWNNIKRICLILLATFLSILLIVPITNVYKMPILGVLFHNIDWFLTLVVHYLPIKWAGLYTIAPLLLTMIVFFAYYGIKYVKARIQEKRIAQEKEELEKEADLKAIQENKVVAKSTEELNEQADTLPDLVNNSSPDFVTTDTLIGFQKEKFSKFQTKNALNLRNVYSKSKALGGLLIKKKNDQYIVVYADGNGFHEAQKLFERLSFDISVLPPHESIITFDKNGVIESIALVDKIDKVKQAERAQIQ